MEEQLLIDPEFESIIPPISPEEFIQLEENIVSEGVLLMPIIIWNGYIVDGHNRYKILRKHSNIPCKTFEKHFGDRYEAIAWICKNQIGTRNLSERYVKYLKGKQYNAEVKSCSFYGNQYTLKKESGLGYFNPDQNPSRHGTRSKVAEKNGVSESMIRYATEFSRGIDAAEEVLPGIKQDILNGQINPTEQAIKNVARAPMEERRKAAENLYHITDKRSITPNNTKGKTAFRVTPDTDADKVPQIKEDDVIKTLKAAVGDLIDLCNNYFTRFPRLLSNEQYQKKTIETLKEFQTYISKIERN